MEGMQEVNQTSASLSNARQKKRFILRPAFETKANALLQAAMC